jgi:hypothetical protein
MDWDVADSADNAMALHSFHRAHKRGRLIVPHEKGRRTMPPPPLELLGFRPAA